MHVSLRTCPWVSPFAPQHTQGFQIICAPVKDEGSGVGYLGTLLKRCLKLNLREYFGEKHKIQSQGGEQ